MVKYLVGILCSSNIRLVHESLNSVLNQKNFTDYEIFIVVNTKNELFYQEVMREFSYHTYSKLKKVIRTESNGYPGKGHNSVLSIFHADNRYDYLVMLDGDDFLFPYALERINNVQIKNNCDVITLAGNTKIMRTPATFEKVHTDPQQLVYSFNITSNYIVRESKNIKNIHPDYNHLLLTPNRLLCISKKILDKYEKLYDERMYVFDDFMYTVILYKETKKAEFNITHLSDPYMYLYNAINDNSVSLQYDTSVQTQNDIIDDKYKREIIKQHVEKYDITELNIIPYDTIVRDTINVQEMQDYHKKMIFKLNSLVAPQMPRKRILFIDYCEWGYNTINERPLGGTESAIYNLSKILANKYTVSVMTKTANTAVIHPHLQYLPLREDLIQSICPDIIVFQGQCPLDRTFFTNINPNIQLWNWLHHDISVAFIKPEVINYPFDKYIFVSNWQKNRYIQQFKMQHNKCVTLPNGISPFIRLDQLQNLPKEKTLVYFSTPYRGLIVAYYLFQVIKKHIPDIKFKIFSCFGREIIKSKLEYLPIKNINDICNNDGDRYYKSVYELLIQDPNIEFYGSVPQKVLFDHVKSAMVFFYPNTYAETCCTSVLEAMAHRCNVISSELGAIPETSNGFANLYNPNIDVLHDKYSADYSITHPVQINELADSYQRQFIDKTVDLVTNYYSDYNQELLSNQQTYISTCTWEKRAELFTQFIPEY
jgi:glycosyltransferase involved in cell wall biosynthesis